MPEEHVVTTLARLSQPTQGVFRVETASALGVTANQLARLSAQGFLERVHPCTYRVAAVAPSHAQHLRAALLWAGDSSAAAGRSAAELYRLEGVRAAGPEIVVPHGTRARTTDVSVCHGDPRALMPRTVAGFRTTGIEATLVRLAHLLDDEPFDIAFEDARRRRLTSVRAMRAYLDRFGRRGRPGVAPTRRALDRLDPVQEARSALEVETRRLLVAHGVEGFVREFPLEWNRRTYRYDFAFPDSRVILETNGRRWHDDPADYEHDHEKWSVPGRHGYGIVFATWEKVTRRPGDLIHELEAAMSSFRPG